MHESSAADPRSQEDERRNSEAPDTRSGPPLWRPPGHYESPLTNAAEIEARRDQIFDRSRVSLGGIDLNAARQHELMRRLLALASEFPFPVERQPSFRYYTGNCWYGYGDALFLYFMMREVKPRRIIEVGSGLSSGLMLDLSDRYLDGALQLCCVDPHPERLQDHLFPRDLERIELIPNAVQDVPLEHFESLQAGDILFIDSSHVAKTGSDVNMLYFEVLPRLAPGVYVHVHDIHYPFEYPDVWVREGRSWNEAYLLRAFLQFNDRFDIVLFNTYLGIQHEAWFREHLPRYLDEPGGSIWLQRNS